MSIAAVDVGSGGCAETVAAAAGSVKCTAEGTRRISGEAQCGQAIKPLASWLSKSSRD